MRNIRGVEVRVVYYQRICIRGDRWGPFRFYDVLWNRPDINGTIDTAWQQVITTYMEILWWISNCKKFEWMSNLTMLKTSDRWPSPCKMATQGWRKYALSRFHNRTEVSSDDEAMMFGLAGQVTSSMTCCYGQLSYTLEVFEGEIYSSMTYNCLHRISHTFYDRIEKTDLKKTACQRIDNVYLARIAAYT